MTRSSRIPLSSAEHPLQGTPVAVTGQNATALTFVSPTFPRGGILVPNAQEAARAEERPRGSGDIGSLALNDSMFGN